MSTFLTNDNNGVIAVALEEDVESGKDYPIFTFVEADYYPDMKEFVTGPTSLMRLLLAGHLLRRDSDLYVPFSNSIERKSHAPHRDAELKCRTTPKQLLRVFGANAQELILANA